MLTDQDFYNKSVAGLRSQNFEQSTVGDACRYRGNNGLKCAIGHLITDEQYFPEMDAGAWRLKHFQRVGLLSDMDERLFLRLQTAHDSALDAAEMQNNLDQIAIDFDLMIPVPEDVT